MKKYFDKGLVLAFLMIFVFFTAACEAEAAKSLRQKSSVLLVFNNIAGTRYDEKLTQIALEKLQPITKETYFNFIYFDKNVETGLVLRIVDLKNGKELYNKKYVMKAKDSTDYFFIGSGSVAHKALDAILFRAGEAISVRLPL